ncbi:MAG: hypothetical protein ACXIVL_03275 [Oceanicaulis sp.]
MTDLQSPPGLKGAAMRAMVNGIGGGGRPAQAGAVRQAMRMTLSEHDAQ